MYLHSLDLATWPAGHKSPFSELIHWFPWKMVSFTYLRCSSVLAWRIPRMGEPGGLPSVGLHRVGPPLFFKWKQNVFSKIKFDVTESSSVQCCLNTCCGREDLVWRWESQALIKTLKYDKYPLWRCHSQKPCIGLLLESHGIDSSPWALIQFRGAKWRKAILFSFCFLESAITKHCPLNS